MIRRCDALVREVKLVVCDMTGTTIRDTGQVTHAFVDTLREYELEFTPEQLHRVRGCSKRQALRNFIPDGPDHGRRAEEVYVSFCHRLAQRFAIDGIEPIDGAEQTFRALRAEGVSVALTTGLGRDVTDLLLKGLKWDEDVVDAVVCGDDVRQGRPAPYLIFHAMETTGTISAHEVVNIGDTVVDLESGYNAGVPFNVGVLSGAHDRATLEQAPHTHILLSIAELPTFLGITTSEFQLSEMR